ncbi:O-antigen ligase family protein [Myroides sp. DF42-4-2]|uniref:O-antigen ligase family protein n=1 Tax=Myroides sp. DF42-4-2 TaxID=2746726 RepID=UPI0025767F94|nr:O-antigen ligase family protein [Myroides sp. DF42-4-2]MDM1408184.1 O-antigen ligase family protein [Myroides sp. DF42-4-2]
MKSKEFWFALTVFLTTIAGMPQELLYIALALFGFITFFSALKNKLLSRSDYLLILFIILNVLFFYYGQIFNLDIDNRFIDVERSNSFFPYGVFIVSSIFIARKFNVDVWKYLLYFILIEIVVGIFEYILGVPYIIKATVVTGDTEFGSTDLLYYNRVYGLSSSSSVFGQKILIGLVLFHLLKNSINYRKISLVLLLAGLFVTFNRTVILAVIVFVLLYYFKNFIYSSIKVKLTIMLGFVLTFSLIFAKFGTIINQFSRGKGTVDATGRDMIFPTFIEIFKDNFIFGNFGSKVYIMVNGHSYHAHNSYLETLTSLGIILSFILFYYLCKNIKRNRFIYVLPFLIYSMAQYGLFWGISLFDLVFFSIIFIKDDSVFNNKI